MLSHMLTNIGKFLLKPYVGKPIFLTSMRTSGKSICTSHSSSLAYLPPETMVYTSLINYNPKNLTPPMLQLHLLQHWHHLNTYPLNAHSFLQLVKLCVQHLNDKMHSKRGCCGFLICDGHMRRNDFIESKCKFLIIQKLYSYCYMNSLVTRYDYMLYMYF